MRRRAVSRRRRLLEAAQANHELLLQGSTPPQIASAEAQLAQAQATLENVLNGVSAEQITIAEAQVEQAASPCRAQKTISPKRRWQRHLTAS